MPAAGLSALADRRDQIAVAAVFLINGVLLGNWVARIPAIKDQVGASTGTLGLALLGLAVGNLLIKPLAGWCVDAYGTTPVTRAGVVLSCAILPVSAIAPSVLVLGLALVAFGVTLGVLDVAMNAHAVAVQERAGRSLMSRLHGLFSVGGLLGAVTGSLAAQVAPVVHFGLVAVLLSGMGFVAGRGLQRFPVRGAQVDADTSSRHDRAGRPARPLRAPLLILGFAGFCGMVGEGASGDWSGIYLRDDLAVDPNLVGFGYAAYSAAMATGRLLGDGFIARWGGLRVVGWSMTVAGAGFGLALAIGHPIAAVAGFAILGLGLSTVMPVAFSLAGRLGGHRSGAAIGLVSSISGAGFLGGPPMIGFAAEAFGLPIALALLSVLAFVGAALMQIFGAVTRDLSSMTLRQQ